MRFLVFIGVVVAVLAGQADAADRYLVKNSRGQVTQRVYVTGNTLRFTDPAGRTTGTAKVKGNTVKYYDRSGRPR